MRNENIHFLPLRERNDSTAAYVIASGPLLKKKKEKPRASFIFSRVSDEKPGIFFIWPYTHKKETGENRLAGFVDKKVSVQIDNQPHSKTAATTTI